MARRVAGARVSERAVLRRSRALRAAEGPALAQCASYEFADVLVDGVDDGAARDIVAQLSFSARFARALDDAAARARTRRAAPARRRGASSCRTPAARCEPRRSREALHVTREHLSRSFAAGGAPNLKRIIDLVRIIAAAELAKNPGYDLRDVANILGFASSSHLSSTAMRVVGTQADVAGTTADGRSGRAVRERARAEPGGDRCGVLKFAQFVRRSASVALSDAAN